MQSIHFYVQIKFNAILVRFLTKFSTLQQQKSRHFDTPISKSLILSVKIFAHNSLLNAENFVQNKKV